MKPALHIYLIVLLSLWLASPAAALDIQKEVAYRAAYGSVDDVAMLLKKGASPTGTNELGWPLVSVAAARSDGLAVPMLKTLVAAGASLDIGGPARQYPIIIAARTGNRELADYLLAELVDVTVRDRNGVLAADVARYNGHDVLADRLEALTDRKREAQEAMRSPERKKQLLYDLAYQSCASQYMHYYFASKQDDYSEEHITTTLEGLRTQVATISNDLYQVFNAPPDDLETIQSESRSKVYRQLEDLISNRNRRKHGVGKESDLKARCTAIAAKWKPAEEAE